MTAKQAVDQLTNLTSSTASAASVNQVAFHIVVEFLCDNGFADIARLLSTAIATKGTYTPSTTVNAKVSQPIGYTRL